MLPITTIDAYEVYRVSPLRKMKARGHSLFLPQEQIQISHRTASGRTERVSFLWKRPLSHWRPFLPRGVLVSTLSSVRRAMSGLSRHIGSWTTVSPFCSSFPACLRFPDESPDQNESLRDRQTLLIIRCTCANFVQWMTYLGISGIAIHAWISEYIQI